jgi:hypothetical protein
MSLYKLEYATKLLNLPINYRRKSNSNKSVKEERDCYLIEKPEVTALEG